MSSPRTLAVVGFATLFSLVAARADAPDLTPLRMGGGATPTGVSRLAFAPDGKTVAWAGSGPLCLYDAASGKFLRSIKMDARCVAFAPDGKTLAVGEGASVHVLNAATGDEVVHVKAHADGVFAVAFSPDGKTLATAGDDDHVGLWDPASGKELARPELHENGVSVLAFSPDGKYLTAGGDSGALTVWLLGDDFQEERRRLVGRDGRVGCVSFLPGGTTFLWTQGSTIRVSELETWVELVRYDGKDMGDACFAVSPDGKTLAAGDGKRIRFWDLETGEELMAFRDEKEAAAVAFAPDGRTLASAAPDGTVLVWDLKGLPKVRLEALWRELGGRDAADAVHAVRAMTAVPAESVAFLRERLRPVTPNPRIPRLIADLDDDDFAVRDRAMAELAKFGWAAEADLKAASGDQPSPEARWRLEMLLGRLEGAFSEETARVRSVPVLETIGTEDARRVLDDLAKGPPDARLTKEAKASLQRMAARPSP